MTVFVTPAGAAGDAVNLTLPLLLMLLALLVLLAEKVVAANVTTPGHGRLSRTLDVGVVPLGMGSLILAGTQLARLIGQGF